MVLKKNKDWVIFFIFLAAFTLRLIYTCQVLKFPLTEYLASSAVFDQYGYDQDAARIMSGDWMGSEVFGKEPLYPYFLAVIYRIFGCNHLTAYIIQAVLTSIGAVLLYKISAKIFNNTVGALAGFIFAFYSMSIYYDAVLLREGLITFSNILLFYLILRERWLSGGLVLGFLTLVRHNMLLPFILIFALCAVRPFNKALRCALIFTAGMSAVILPVVMRNYIVSDGRYAGISKEVNAFWVGNNYKSSGVDVDWSEEYARVNNKAGGSILRTAAVFFEEVRKRPVIYAKLYARKTWMFLNAYEAPSNTNYYLYREEFPTILRWPFFDFRVVCALGIVGIFLAFAAGYRPYMLYIFLFVLSFSVILFHVQSRFRLPATPFFMIFSAYGLYHIIEVIKKRYYAGAVIAVAISAFLYLVLKPDLTYAGFRKEQDKIRPFDRTNLALSYADAYNKSKNTGLLRAILRQCNLALKEDKTFSTAYRIKGHVYFLEKRYGESIFEYKKALIYGNRNAMLYNDLGGVYYEVKDYKKASLLTARALRLFPHNKLFEKNLSLIPR